MSEEISRGEGGASRLTVKMFGPDSGARQMMGLGVWFGGWRDGRLGRIGYVLAAFTLYGLLGLAQWFLADAMRPEPIQLTPSYEPMSATERLFGIGASLAVAVLTLAIGLNLAAKRIRAIGAPGWGGALVLTVINGAAIYFAASVAYPWLSVAVLAALILLPNNILKGRAS